MAEDAFYGLAGDIAYAIDPHSEADPAATLVQLLTAVGNDLVLRNRAAGWQTATRQED